jgi:signal transduction histidine kinase
MFKKTLFWLWSSIFLLCLLVGVGLIWIYTGMPVDGATGDLESFSSRGFLVQWLLEERPGGLRVGDVIVRGGGHTVDEWLDGAQREPQWAPGGLVTYEILRDGQLLELPISLAPVPTRAIVDRWWQQLLVSLGLLIIGGFVFWKRPSDQAARLLMLFCTMIAVQTWGDAYNFQYAILGWRPVFWFQFLVENVSFILIYASVLHFTLVFPETHPLLERHPRLTLLAIYGAHPALIALVMALSPTWSQALRTGSSVSWVIVLAQIILSLAASVRSTRTAKNPVSRAQISWILWGGGLAMMVAVPGYILPILFYGRPIIPPPVVFLLCGFVIVVFAIPILRYRLFDIEIVINRTLVYGALSTLLIGLYLGLVRILSLLVQALLHKEYDAPVVFFATIGIALAFNPLRERVQRVIDRSLYRQKLNYQRLLPEMTERLATSILPDQFAQLMTGELPHRLQIRKAALLVLDENGKGFAALHNDDIPLLSTVHPLVETMRRYGRPLLRLLSPQQLPTQAQEWLEQYGVELTIPLVIREEMVGLYNLGAKLSGDLYTAEEVRVLHLLGQQAAVGVQNMRLFQAEQEQRRKAEALAERMAYLAAVSEDLSQNFSLEEVINNITAGVHALSAADQVALFHINSEDQLECLGQVGLSVGFVEQVTELHNASMGLNLFDQVGEALIRDTFELPAENPWRKLSRARNLRSIGLWPLIYQGVVIATVELYYDRPHEWSEDQRDILTAFTRQAAVALQNVRLFAETRRRAAQQEAVNKIIALVVTAPDPNVMLEGVLDLTLGALDVSAGGIWAAGYIAQRNVPREFEDAAVLLAQECEAKISEVVIIEDWGKHANGPNAEWMAFLEEKGVHALLVVPVLAGHRSIGALALVDSRPRKWTLDEVALSEAVGRQLGSAVERFELLARTQEQARQVQQIIDTVPEGVLLLDIDKRIILANPAARQYLVDLNGQDQPDVALTRLVEHNIDELLDSDVSQPWREISKAGPPQLVFEVAARPLQSEATLAGWVLVLRNVTLERETQAQIQMQERLATVGQLAAGIAHDFNNIMAAIRVYTDLLTLDANISTSSQERLVVIQNQIERATRLIRQILDFSRRAVMDKTDLDLLSLAKDTIKLLERLLPENIRIQLDSQPGSYMLRADPGRMQQVFMNLALNAGDAMPSGGLLRFEFNRLQLEVGEKPPYPDLAPGAWIYIRVSDTGTGIPADDLPRIFNPFFTTKPVGQGTGLGLAQVYGIVKQHGGSIDVHSTLGEGTSFSIYLPELMVQQVEHQPQTEKLTSLIGDGETVLVVEDDDATRQAMKNLLEELNYRVLLAANGNEALRICEEEMSAIKLVVSDVVMPEMGGASLYNTLLEKQIRLKFLYISGYPLKTRPAQEAGQRMDFEDHLTLNPSWVQWLEKPFSVEEFARSVRALLDKNDWGNP